MEFTRAIDMIDGPNVYGHAPPSSSVSSGLSAHREPISLRASQACIACRKQKRKCDKQLPACSLCSRMSRECDYSGAEPTPNADDFALLRQKVSELESKLEARDTPWGRSSTIGGVRFGASPSTSSVSDAAPSIFPTMFFLDTEIFQVGANQPCVDSNAPASKRCLATVNAD
jgi:hypothetical protein